MKIAFIYHFFSPFVRQDYEILSRHFEIEKINYRKTEDIIKMVRAIINSDLTYSWFASGHSFIALILSRILNKRSIVIVGGYDVAYVPEINYGQFTLGMAKRFYAKYVLKNADIVLAVSKFTQSEVNARTKPRMLKIIYNGINTDEFSPGGKKENLVLTVAGSGYNLGDDISETENIIKLKGIDTFARAAERFPNTNFFVIGLSKLGIRILKKKYPFPNLEFTGYVPQTELLEFYRRAKVYCQLSFRESFGVALAEAMACGCVPVVTDRGALPEVVGDTGFYVQYGDGKATAEAIGNALRSDRGAIARKRIEDMFSLREREKVLIELIEKLYLSK